jgi:hypothetical protein
MKAMSLEQQLERSLHQVRASKAAAARDDLADWLEAAPPPEAKRPKRLGRKKQKMTNAIQKAEPEQLAPVRHIRDDLAEWRAMREQASELVKSGFLPRAVNTPEKAMAIIQTGKELGLGPMQSLRSIHIIEGKPTMSADLIAGLALAKLPGSVLRVVESSDKKCVIEAGRSGQKLTPFEYTMADAQRAGLAGKDNWKKHPRAMLRARAITEAARAIFPDTCVGLYDPDELGAVTGPSGEVVELPRVEDVTPLPHVSPHSTSPDENPERHDPVVLLRAMSFFAECDKAIFDPGCDWATVVKWRGLLGHRGNLTELGKSISRLYRSDISEDERKELGKVWQRVERKLADLEAKLKPPPIEASFQDEPDDGTEALGAPSREPGEEG